MEHNVTAMTRRILRWHDKASVEQLEEGAGWYLGARYFTGELAKFTPYTVEQVAAVVAVLSPQVNWDANQMAATRAVELHLQGDWDGTDLPGYPGYKLNVLKAKRILDGDMSALVGPKVTAFYNAIRGDLSDVVVDVWATRAARADLDNKARVFRDDEMPKASERKAIIEAYRRAAVLRGTAPSEMQAIVWVTIRDSGRFRKPQGRSEVEARRFYRSQIAARQKLGLPLYTYASYWENTPIGREMTLEAIA